MKVFFLQRKILLKIISNIIDIDDMSINSAILLKPTIS